MVFSWWLTAVLLGIVEGATEFIPVSSTGHLIVASEWLGFTGASANTFVVFIQLGAILAIVWLYRAMLARVAMEWHRDATSRQFLINLGIAFIPAAVAGLLLHRTIKAYLFNPVTVAAALVAGGVAILMIERWQPSRRAERVEHVADMPWKTALGVGLAQMLALIPGVSRSGATIMGGYSLGLSRRAATEFSFFLAIPVMFAATLFDLVESRHVIARTDAPLFAVGFIVSFLSALVVVRAFLVYVSRHSFSGFAWYRIAFGALLLAMYVGARSLPASSLESPAPDALERDRIIRCELDDGSQRLAGMHPLTSVARTQCISAWRSTLMPKAYPAGENW